MNSKEYIKEQLDISLKQIEAVLNLLAEGNSVPFIARYRKEQTGNLDEEQIRKVQELYAYQENLKERKQQVLKLIEQKGHLDENLKNSINNCQKLSEVEALYKPYKQNKKTRAGIALENKLQPVSEMIVKHQLSKNTDLTSFTTDQFKSVDDVLQGAMDIIAENISNDEIIRNKVHDSFVNYGKITSKKMRNAKDEEYIYEMYYDHQEPVSTLANHRILAMIRGEKQKVLKVEIQTNDDYLLNFIKYRYLRKNSYANKYLELAIEDAYKRLLKPSINNLVKTELFNKASDGAIDVFALNLENLLMINPLKQKCVLGFDPAYRTGCKLAVLDGYGDVLKIDVIYPHAPQNKWEEAKAQLLELINEYHIDIVAIGNGTASRESEKLVAEVIKDNNLNIQYAIVNEAGASVYSASKKAIEEFPDLTVEKRSAISIGRRLQDPLSELIKIDPEAMGVGQYQHDLNQKQLKERLAFVISKCVNQVGVNLNTASEELLTNISGLNKTLANRIVDYRKRKTFNNREELLDIKGLGEKAYKQAAGFLRIIDGNEILDKTSIHPESYALTKQIIQDYGLDLNNIGSVAFNEELKRLSIDELVNKYKTDKYTLEDIIDCLTKPLRDYRENNPSAILRSDLLKIEDLNIGDELLGTVRNVVDFGAFVDIGLKDDGLIHISKFNQKINHPSEIVNVGDIVKVKIDKIDEHKNKVQLSYIND